MTSDRAEALAHAAACGRVVIEEYLDGPEVSLFCVTDGTTVLPLSQRRTSSASATATPVRTPAGWVPTHRCRGCPTDSPTKWCARLPGRPSTRWRAAAPRSPGCCISVWRSLRRGIRVVEFNARFGDPETQVVLALLETPLGALLHAAASGTLAGQPPLRWRDGAAVTVVIAAANYPAHAARR